MPYKDLVKCWHEGVLAADKKDLDSALKIFTGIEDPPSKIWFNIGCIHLLREDFQGALQAYSQSVTKDQCLAVGFFQRSYVHFKLQLYEKALGDCHLATAQLRTNSVIDYKQLGLNHLLYAWEVLYNTASILCYLGKWETAQQKIDEAAKWVPGDIRSTKLEAAHAQIQNRQLFPPIHIADGEIFRPRKQEVERLNSKDFLGKPKIISSVVPNDQYSGFEPLRPQKPGFYQPCQEAMQGRDSGYHRVLVHYYPENSGEVAVKANSILFVLNKHGDWATAIHDGQKILIPTNFLEPVEAPKADMKKINNGIPLPPMKMPPTRPNAKTAGTPLLSQHAPPQPTTELPLPTENQKRENPGAFSKEDQVVATTVHEEDEEDLAKTVPLGADQLEQMSVHPGPAETTSFTVTRKAAPPRPLQRVEMVVTLQSSAPVNQEVEKGITGTDQEKNVYEAEAPPLRKDPLTLREDPLTLREDPLTLREDPLTLREDPLTLQVHTEFTVDLSVSKNITYQELQRLLRNKLREQGEQMNVHLSYRDIEGKKLTSVKDDGDLRGMWKQVKDKRLIICCKDYHCVGRPILSRLKAIYTYTADGPEDLPFKQGDIIDILSEVNEEWLEGHCNGSIGIFPRCFVSEQITS